MLHTTRILDQKFLKMANCWPNTAPTEEDHDFAKWKTDSQLLVNKAHQNC